MNQEHTSSSCYIIDPESQSIVDAESFSSTYSRIEVKKIENLYTNGEESYDLIDTPSEQSHPQEKQEDFLFKLKSEYKEISWKPGATLTMPFLLSFHVNMPHPKEKASIDLVCAIDRSGSMCGSKIANVKRSFKFLLNYLSEKDTLSVVIFNSRADVIFP